MRLWSIAVSAGIAAVVAGYVYSVFWLYGYWSERAAREIADTRSYRMDCPTSNPLECTFTEVPVRVNQFADVILPTVFWAGVLLVAVVGAAVCLARYCSHTDAEAQ